MFKALVRSHLAYCDIIYHIPSKQDQFGVTLNSLMEKVEIFQYQTALAVTGAWQRSTRSNRSKPWCKRILHIHKVVGNETPLYKISQKPS